MLPLCRASLKKLVAMVGRSTTIYRRICTVLAASLRSSSSGAFGFPEAALCTLRSQLLMALHDDNILHPTQTPFSFDQVCACVLILFDKLLPACSALCSLLCQSWTCKG